MVVVDGGEQPTSTLLILLDPVVLVAIVLPFKLQLLLLLFVMQWGFSACC